MNEVRSEMSKQFTEMREAQDKKLNAMQETMLQCLCVCVCAILRRSGQRLRWRRSERLRA